MMKKVLSYLLLVLGIVSCNYHYVRKISQSEFNRLFTHDSIASIQLAMGKKQALIILKITGNDDGKRILEIESTDKFQNLLRRLENKLLIENIHPTYQTSFISSDSQSLFLFKPAILWILNLGIVILLIIVMIDILRYKFESDMLKLIWVLVVLFIPLVGPLIYLFVGRKQQKTTM